MCELNLEKCQAVILMHQENISNVRIAHRCDCSESTVSPLLKSFKTEGTLDKKLRSRSDRPRLPSKRTNATLTQSWHKNRFPSSAKLPREQNDITSVIASARTVGRRVL